MLTWGRQNYLGSKISRSQMCYMWSEICSGPDYLGSDISTSITDDDVTILSKFYKLAFLTKR